jgi:integrase
MSENKRITVWVQHQADRPHLTLRWTDPETGRIKGQTAGTANPKDAEKARAELEYELNHGLRKQASGMTWERFRQLFEEEYVAFRRQNTRENYQSMFDGFERLCHPKALRTVTGRMVSRYKAALLSEPGRAKGSVGQAPATIRQRLQLLKTALTWAVRQGLLPELPTFEAVKVPKRRPQPVAVEAFERLLEKAPDAQFRAYLLAGWLAGLRLAEAVALEREHAEDAPYLDLARDRIVFPADAVKAGEDQWVPLDPELKAALLALPRHGQKVFRFVAKDGHPIGLNAVGERVIRLAKKAGVKLTMHSLRKGFGCRYAGKVPAQVLQRLMRHSNVSLTMTYYANVDDAMMQAVLGARHTAGHTGGRSVPEGEVTPSPQPEGPEQV